MQDLVAAPQEQYTPQEVQAQELFLEKLKLSKDFERTLEVKERENVDTKIKKEAEFEIKKGESFSYKYTYLGKDYHGDFSAVSQDVSYNTENTLNAKYLHNGLSLERVEAGINADGEPIYKMKLNIPSSFTGAVHITTSSGEAVIFSDVDYIEPKSQVIEREPEILEETDAGEIVSKLVDEQAKELGVELMATPLQNSSYENTSSVLQDDFSLSNFGFSDFNMREISDFQNVNDNLIDSFYLGDDLGSPLSSVEPEVSLSDAEVEGEIEEPIILEPPNRYDVEPKPSSSEVEVQEEIDEPIISEPPNRYDVEPKVIEQPARSVETTVGQDFSDAAGNLLNFFSEYFSEGRYNIRGSEGELLPVVSAIHLNSFADIARLGNNPVAKVIKTIPPGGEMTHFGTVSAKTGHRCYMVLDSKTQTFSMFNQLALSTYVERAIRKNKNSEDPIINPDQLRKGDIQRYIGAYETYHPEEYVPAMPINGHVVIRDSQGRMILQSTTNMDKRLVLFDPKEIEESKDIASYAGVNHNPNAGRLRPVRPNLYGNPTSYSRANSFGQSL